MANVRLIMKACDCSEEIAHEIMGRMASQRFRFSSASEAQIIRAAKRIHKENYRG